MNTAIGSYVHGDDLNKRKGGCQVMVGAETDFALKTDSFLEFCDYVARMCYAIIKTIPEDDLFEDEEEDGPFYGSCFTWEALLTANHDAEELEKEIIEKKKKIEEELGEDVDILDMTCIFQI